MKNNVPNELLYEPDNVLLLRKFFALMRKPLLLLIFAFYTANLSAQDTDNPNIMEINAYLASLRTNGATLRSANTPNPVAQGIENLLYKAQPSVYYYAGVLNTYGEKPRNLFTDVASLNGLNNPNLSKNNIEMVTIRINSANELNATIDLSLFSSFKNLKYVYLLSEVNASAQQFTTMVINPQERLRVFYKIQLGENNQ